MADAVVVGIATNQQFVLILVHREACRVEELQIAMPEIQLSQQFDLGGLLANLNPRYPIDNDSRSFGTVSVVSSQNEAELGLITDCQVEVVL